MCFLLVSKKKTARLFRLAVFWILGVRLADSLRQHAGEIKEERKKEEAAHSRRFKHGSAGLST
jgi:hypothetical protein